MLTLQQHHYSARGKIAKQDSPLNPGSMSLVDKILKEKRNLGKDWTFPKLTFYQLKAMVWLSMNVPLDSDQELVVREAMVYVQKLNTV